MAIWQFDFQIIPKGKYTFEPDSLFLDYIDFLKKQKSWSNKILQYGEEDKTCIQFFCENKLITEVLCRLDLRSLSKNDLMKILHYIKKINGMVFYEGEAYKPDFDSVVKLLKNSEANEFCKDPFGYIKKLKRD